MKELLRTAYDAMDERLAEDLVVIDFRGQSAFLDYFVIGTAKNYRMAKSIIDNVVFIQYLAICPFIGMTSETDKATGMGIATSFVIILATVISIILEKTCGLKTDTIGQFANGTEHYVIPNTLPLPQLPDFKLSTITTLFPTAVSIAVLAAIESLLSAVVADGMIGTKHDSNTELIAQGIANIASPVFGGIPATGAIARTATNIKNGGKTPVAGMIHAITLLLILLFFGKYAAYIPMPALAAILINVAWNMAGFPAIKALLKKVDFPTFGKPTSPTSAMLFNSKITVNSLELPPG